MSKIENKKNKIVIIGDSNVGKTCIIERLINNSFDETKPTIGACHYEKTVNDLKLDIWDTAGQERFRSMIPMYYKGAKAVIITFDITSSESFEGAKKWLNEIKENANDSFIILVGNKTDLEDSRVISKEFADNFSKENNLDYIETSAKDNVNVNNLFENIAKKINDVKANDELSNVRISELNKENKGGLCC